eukprot:TRINITY_DN4422_c0_g2_i1.p1 TRINITY_DN4422_c0_g2~~TRINITY_DN4422_c0_g2_i1.p1  ORF type:complete len:123 (+),score=0.51 TRINITY_DN4422_c0_g2_i1:408-776(+)
MKIVNNMIANFDWNTYYDMSTRWHTVHYNEAKILQSIRNLLIEAVKCRLNADKPICCLLSGGLDSSLITALVADLKYKQRANDIKHRKKFKYYEYELHTFCIGMENGTDLNYAQDCSGLFKI